MSLVSWIALIIVILLVIGAIFVIVNDKKSGKSSCGCGMGCAGCSACGSGCASCAAQDKAKEHNA